MIPELGYFALIMAFFLALAQAVFPLVGAQRGYINWMAVAKPAATGQFVFILLAFFCLVNAFVTNDFSVLYVVNHSNSQLPIIYRVSAVWGGHEGSLLLWVLILAGWTIAVAALSHSLPLRVSSRVLGVMGLISIGFLLFILLTSSPFLRVLPAAPDGQDLNPLLQDPGLIIHPPMLYMGYVGFAVAFSFAIAALLDGQFDAAWARWTRPWTTVAWLFLTIGITLGSWWAYYELGWGGWWFWDPVENASFMPWLAGTALIHSLAVTEKRGVFKAWTVLLAILAFSLSLLGTFLVRSGVLTSVHAFATDPERGLFILVFLAFVVGGSLLLYAWRAPRLSSLGRFRTFSRESLLLINNVFLIVCCAAVLLGTLYPLILDALGGGKISVGPPYFEKIFMPLSLPLVFLIGIGMTVSWGQSDVRTWLRNMVWVGVLSVVLTLALIMFSMISFSVPMALSIFFSLWVVLTIGQSFSDRLRRRKSVWQGLQAIPRSYYGMQLAHFGVAIFTLGVAVVGHLGQEDTVRMVPGESFEIAGYAFHFERMDQVEGPNYVAQQGLFEVKRAGQSVGQLQAQKRTYAVQKKPMTEAGIDAGLFRDLFVALGEPLGQDAWSVRIQYKPFIRWIWLGAFLMAFGGGLAASDRRYRKVNRSVVIGKSTHQVDELQT